MGKKVQTNQSKTKRKKPNNNFMLSSILILMIFLTICIIYIERENKKEIRQLQEIVESNKLNNNSNETNSEQPAENQPIPTTCNRNLEATYYGEFSGPVGNFTLTEQQTLTLKEDGTFVRGYQNGGGTSGTYIINNGILILTYIPMGAPNNYTATDTLSISSDCSTIAIKGEGYSYNLNQQ